jgi:IS30 family transposase
MAMNYRQLNAQERSVLAALRTLGLSVAEMGRHRSTIWRELRRNSAPYDGGYRSARAHQRCHARRWRTRRHSQFALDGHRGAAVRGSEDHAEDEAAGGVVRRRP